MAQPELTWAQPLAWRMDGAVAGVWRHERRGARVEVTIEPFAPLEPWAAEQLEGDAERLARYLGAELTLRGTS